MGGRAAGAGPHLHGGLPHDQAIAAGDDERLDRVAQVLGRIVLGEQADRLLLAKTLAANWPKHASIPILYMAN